jgi:two-component system, LytTR family, response regulator
MGGVEVPSMKIRTFVIDDEPLARLNLTSLLAEEEDIELAGEYGNGRTAAEAISEHRPDLVFLDIQMPNMSGLEAIELLPADVRPIVVFVTAFDRYAVPAFDVQALDYLLKPFRRERFKQTLNRVRSHLSERGGIREPSMPTPQAGGGRAPDRIAVKCGDRLVFVEVDELEYVRAAANYVQLHAGDRVYDVREKISAMQARLPADRFLRVHRSYLVNLAAVLELYPIGGGDYMIALRSGRQLPVGPTYPPSIRRSLIEARLPHFGGV